MSFSAAFHPIFLGALRWPLAGAARDGWPGEAASGGTGRWG